jgi:hypothetical protein
MWWTEISGRAARIVSVTTFPLANPASASSGSLPISRTGHRKVCGSHGTPRAAATWMSAPLEAEEDGGIGPPREQSRHPVGDGVKIEAIELRPTDGFGHAADRVDPFPYPSRQAVNRGHCQVQQRIATERGDIAVIQESANRLHHRRRRVETGDARRGTDTHHLRMSASCESHDPTTRARTDCSSGSSRLNDPKSVLLFRKSR